MVFKKANLDYLMIARDNPQVVQAAREWAKDCVWGETDEDPENSFIDQMPAHQVLKAVNKNYHGGLEGFMADAFYEEPVNSPEMEKTAQTTTNPNNWQDRKGNWDPKQMNDIQRVLAYAQQHNIANDPTTLWYFSKGLIDENFANNVLAFQKSPVITSAPQSQAMSPGLSPNTKPMY